MNGEDPCGKSCLAGQRKLRKGSGEICLLQCPYGTKKYPCDTLAVLSDTLSIPHFPQAVRKIRHGRSILPWESPTPPGCKCIPLMNIVRCKEYLRKNNIPVKLKSIKISSCNLI